MVGVVSEFDEVVWKVQTRHRYCRTNAWSFRILPPTHLLACARSSGSETIDKERKFAIWMPFYFVT